MILKLSVLMPIYNAEQYVAEAIESILAQTFREFEFVIVDDGSTDGSLAIVRQYESQDPRVRVIARPNTGIVGALNDGLAIARGEFIARMDADDVSTPKRLRVQLEAISRSSNLVAVGGGWKPRGPAGQLGPQARMFVDHISIEKSLLLGNGIAMLHPTVMMRRSAVVEVGGYRQHIRNAHEDLDLFLRLARIGRLGNLKDVLLHWRRHELSNTATATKSERSAEAVESILQEAYAARGMSYPPDWDGERRRLDPFGTSIREGWQSLKGRQRQKAFASALSALATQPLDVRGWKLLACSMRGY